MALVHYPNEYGRLKKVVLYRPRIDEIEQTDYQNAMYLAAPNPRRILEEFDGIVRAFRKLGVAVIILEDTKGRLESCPNMIFLRDVASVIDDHIILGRMKYTVRKNEPEKFTTLLLHTNQQFQRHLVSLPKGQTMEGADILLGPDGMIFTYTGYRTSKAASDTVGRLTGKHLVATQANIHRVPQHLLGGMHIVSSDLLIRRPAHCPMPLAGFSSIDLEETEEIIQNFAMNIVTIDANEILMPTGCPKTKAIFEAAGIRCHTVAISEIHKMGGGLACMTLPLEREIA